MQGYFSVYRDAKQGKLRLEIGKWDSEFLYQSGLSACVGSSDIGLDRRQLGATRIVRFSAQRPQSAPGPGESRLPRQRQRRGGASRGTRFILTGPLLASGDMISNGASDNSP